MLWKQLARIGVPSKFLSVLQTKCRPKFWQGSCQIPSGLMLGEARLYCCTNPFQFLASSITNFFHLVLDTKMMFIWNTSFICLISDASRPTWRKYLTEAQTSICKRLYSSDPTPQHNLQLASVLWPSDPRQKSHDPTHYSTTCRPHLFQINNIPPNMGHHFIYLSSDCSLNFEISSPINKAFDWPVPYLCKSFWEQNSEDQHQDCFI